MVQGEGLHRSGGTVPTSVDALPRWRSDSLSALLFIMWQLRGRDLCITLRVTLQPPLYSNGFDEMLWNTVMHVIWFMMSFGCNVVWLAALHLASGADALTAFSRLRAGT